ncbi:cold-shock protein [Paenibacillus sp. WLX1005]|uniref:cold-shock protein n=1 Tax=unclassified Paenibacillus TaxID=185978 RepID=UPI003984207F
MYYSRKNPMQEIPKEMTDVWECSKPDCNSWMRRAFALEDEPVCAICKSPMVHGQKELPVLDYDAKDKSAKK